MTLRTILCLIVLALASVLVSAPAHANSAPPAYGTISTDVVALSRGAEVKGVETIFVEHQGYRYLFATEATAAEFSADPTKFEVRMDGMCAKMGPLAGRGSTEITAVYKGRLYLCASEACKSVFLKAPGRHIDLDDPTPAHHPQNEAVGHERVARATKVHLGEGGPDAVKVFEQVFDEDVKQGDTMYHHVDTLVIGADGSVRSQSAWNESVYAFVATPTDAWMETSGQPTEPMYEAGRRELERRVRDVHWLSVLRAGAQPDAVVLGLPPAKLLGGPNWIDRVLVSRNGITCILGLDQTTGRIRCVDFTARGKDHTFSPRTRVFESYESVDGILVPTSWTDHASGEQLSAQAGVAVRVNDAVAGNPFVRPAD